MEDRTNSPAQTTRAAVSPTKATKETGVASSVDVVLRQQQLLEHYQQQLQEQKQQIQVQQKQLDRLLRELSQFKKPPSGKRWNRHLALEKLKSYLNGINGSSKYQPRFPLRQVLFSYIGSFIGIELWLT
jgi:hypothetical protein